MVTVYVYNELLTSVFGLSSILNKLTAGAEAGAAATAAAAATAVAAAAAAAAAVTVCVQACALHSSRILSSSVFAPRSNNS
jgi:hypothetical protein